MSASRDVKSRPKQRPQNYLTIKRNSSTERIELNWFNDAKHFQVNIL